MDISRQTLYLVSGFNEKYLEKSMEYIRTMNQHSDAKNIMITLDFHASQDFKDRFSKIDFRHISSDQIKAANSNTCMQHGGFLEALSDIDENALIIYTDTDIVIQRTFQNSDYELFSKYQDGQVLVNFNATEDYTLMDEVKYLKPLADWSAIEKIFPGSAAMQIYNTGVMAANHRTYKMLYQEYIQRWPDIDLLFEHYAKQQWLLSYLIQTKFSFSFLPYTIHTHNCKHPWNLRVDESIAEFKFCIGNDIVLLRHNLIPSSQREVKKLNRRIRRYKITVAVLTTVLFVSGMMFLIKWWMR